MTDQSWVHGDFARGFPVETLPTLMDSVDGAFLVTTNDAIHIIDLDAQAIQRTVRNDVDHPVARLRRDDEWISLVRLIDCTVGRRLSFVADLGLGGEFVTLRRNTEVVSIVRILAGAE